MGSLVTTAAAVAAAIIQLAGNQSANMCAYRARLSKIPITNFIFNRFFS